MKRRFTFVDLFSGIGGFRIALHRCGGICKGFSEVDKNAIETYTNNFLQKDDSEWNLGDIQKVNKLPEFVDMLVGGVPCQSWSVAGKMRGFDDPRGKLWEDTIRLVKINQPKVFIFENVKGLADPRNRNNLNLIIKKLELAGYNVIPPQLLNSFDFGLPQNRARIFIVGFRNDITIPNEFKYPNKLNKSKFIYDFIKGIEKNNIPKLKFKTSELFEGKVPMSRNSFQKDDELNDFFVFCDTRNGHTSIHSWDIVDTTNREKQIGMTFLKNRRKQKYGNRDGNPLSLADLQNLISDIKSDELSNLINKKILRRTIEGKYGLVNTKNSSGINGIYRVYLPNSNIFSTLTATGTRDYIATQTITGTTPEEYRHNFINDIYKKGNYRQLNPREAGLLQGFPKSFKYHQKTTVAHKQFGNAVSVNVVQNLMKSIIKTGIFDKIGDNTNNDYLRNQTNYSGETRSLGQIYLSQESQIQYPKVRPTQNI
ncbi:DNA (cytosine-5-)-methyltransferase [Candidatus Shapirobacteria bacterium CG03_land_8_20_14_0_80_35_14]|uniref:Cytosine-specific methyltransferase n=2 Tax=Candidatus Shapironibacteriota TaxID=1752721 RepID=A0A2M7BQG7_9BACT|nr:MAG: DNA (cytosine-5-)-methyltransferase [Candidatus Shapirobacteria bacterium CG03_land_8_20_14_0_80_35_14]